MYFPVIKYTLVDNKSLSFSGSVLNFILKECCANALVRFRCNKNTWRGFEKRSCFGTENLFPSPQTCLEMSHGLPWLETPVFLLISCQNIQQYHAYKYKKSSLKLWSLARQPQLLQPLPPPDMTWHVDNRFHAPNLFKSFSMVSGL